MRYVCGTFTSWLKSDTGALISSEMTERVSVESMFNLVKTIPCGGATTRRERVRRRREMSQIPSPTSRSAAMPPTTPPAMAPDEVCEVAIAAPGDDVAVSTPDTDSVEVAMLLVKVGIGEPDAGLYMDVSPCVKKRDTVRELTRSLRKHRVSSCQPGRMG